MNAILKKFGSSANKRAYTMLIVLIVMVIICAMVSPTFRSTRNLLNILNQNAIYGIMSLGMCCVILTGAIDLSAGSIAALAGVIATPVFRDHGFVAGMAAGLLTGAALGFINGILITKAKITYFVVTLGMMSIARGAVYIITNGIPVQGVPIAYNIVGMGRIGPVPVAALIWLSLSVVMYLLLKFTRFGQHIYALGGNETAAWLSGVNKDLVKTVAFALCGTFFALGGLVLNLRVLMATADAAQGYELTLIASCVIGGISIEGGSGNILSSITGVLIMGLILNILQLMGVSSYWQSAVTGVIIIAAVGIDSLSSKRRD